MKPDVGKDGSGDGEFIKQISEFCEKIASLKKIDNISRRNTLKEIHNILLTADKSLLLYINSKEITDNLVNTLISTLADDSEKCREISAKVLKHIFHHLPVSEKALSPLFSILTIRLCKTDEREKSEEVRLLEIDLLYNLIDNFEGDLLNHFNDIARIISSCIVDECPEIKRKGCECLSLLAYKQTSNFHMVGSTFLKPLLSTISHQHLKTRTLCINALGCIAKYLNGDEFEQVTSHLAQRLFDHSPIVRLTVTKVIGEMLISLPNRYSYFQRLIPLVLSTLYDEVQDVRSIGQDVWNNAGNQYLKENDKDYKDLIDFPDPDPDDYPDADGRPLFGCRVLVQRNAFNILPALLNDLTDWAPETRIKSSRVLCSLILHSEGKITIQLSSVIEGILLAAKDDEKEIVDNVLKSAEMLGYFIDPGLLSDTILSLIHKAPSGVHLSVLAASLRGHKGELPYECLTSISKFLSDPSISRFRQPHEQANLLLCIEALLASGNRIDHSTSYYLFTILTSISGLTINDSVSVKASELLKNLCESQSCTEESLFQEHAVLLLNTLTENNILWTSQSPEMPIFHFIVGSGHLNQEMVTLIIPVLINNLHPSKDAKLRSRILSVLIPLFEKLSLSDYELFSGKILTLIQSGIFPNLNWAAGKTASSLRTVAAASLFEILKKSCLKKQMLTSISNELLPILATLSDDDDVTNRLLSGKILEIILPELKDCVDEMKIHKTCFEILRCMDDESDDIRMMTLKVLKAYIKSFPDDYDWKSYRAYLKHMFENVLIHMDDKNEEIRMRVLNMLKDVAYAAPDVLLNEIEAKRYMMCTEDLCDNLTNHIKNIQL